MTLGDIFSNTMRSGPEECWTWLGRIDRGYGKIGTILVHRRVYQLMNGALPPCGYHVHHKCRNKACCKPSHLQAIPSGLHARMHNDKFLPELLAKPPHVDHSMPSSRGHAVGTKSSKLCSKCKSQPSRQQGGGYCLACHREYMTELRTGSLLTRVNTAQIAKHERRLKTSEPTQ